MVKQTVKDTLNDFLYRQIEQNPDYQAWEREYEIPSYITDNLPKEKQLRGYQEKGLKHFIWLFENDREKAKHLLFNMATGTGKTLVMAAVTLFLYRQGYRNFLFLVHQVQIRDQAIKNFTDPKFDKYLFAKKVVIDGKTVPIRQVTNISKGSSDGINFLFFSTQMLFARINDYVENSISIDTFKDKNIVVIADEAHRLNVDTRKKTKEAEDAKNWEKAVTEAINANPNNMLLEFTATVDFKNKNIHEKYKDKIVHRYDFASFNADGFSKDVRFLHNQEIHNEDQRRLLIVNAVVLSQYRKLYAEKEMGVLMTPIVLVKSKQIRDSETDREFFNKVIESINPQDLKHLKKLNKDTTHGYGFAEQMFDWLEKTYRGQDKNGGIDTLLRGIRFDFAPQNTLIYNSKTKEKADLLPLLDSERNKIRAIFSVNALNEGWDVLGLYDIIHFDISPSKKVSAQDIQLIGRGARYNPYELPAKYKKLAFNADETFDFGAEHGTFEFNKFKRKFDRAPGNPGKILETFVYHFVKTGVFLEELQKELLDKGIVKDGIEKKTTYLKSGFQNSETYKKGFVLVNDLEWRTRSNEQEIETTFSRSITAGSYSLHASGISDYEQNKITASRKTKDIQITPEYFSEQLIRTALVRAENGFFRFSNLSQHIPEMESVDHLIETLLPKYEVRYRYEVGKEIETLPADEKLNLLITGILPEVRKSIDTNLAKVKGSDRFRPAPLSAFFPPELSIYLTAQPDTLDPDNGFKSRDERAKPQTGNENPELEYDVRNASWYAYDENYGTSEEKRFVKFVGEHIDSVKAKYSGAEIFLLRNELKYWLYNPKDGTRFSPDYVMIINDVVNRKYYFQCLFEPKGGHLLEHDEWKEELLASIEEFSIDFMVQDENLFEFDSEYADTGDQKVSKTLGYDEVKALGFPFFNTSEDSKLNDFELEFQQKLMQ